MDSYLGIIDFQNGFLVMIQVFHPKVGDSESPIAHSEVFLQGPILATLLPVSLLQPVIHQIERGEGGKRFFLCSSQRERSRSFHPSLVTYWLLWELDHKHRAEHTP